jgi:ribose transport system permease protein
MKERLIRVMAIGDVGVVVALAVAVIVFYALEPAFLSARNVNSMLNIVSFIGMVAIGQTILLINGEFDLSVGSAAGLAAVVSAKLMTVSGWPVSLALLGGLLCGGALGWVNGWAVVRLRIPAFIQTLGMLFIGQGLIQVVTGGYPVYPLPEVVGAFGRTTVIGRLGGSFVFFGLAALAADLLLRHSVIGRNMYAVGGNVRVAELVGIPAHRYKISAFVLVGMLSSVAGMFVMADLGSATTGIGSGWELAVIAGVVVGGVSLFGGVGTIFGGLLGVLLLQVVQSGLVTVGVSANWQQIAVGLIMIAAVGLDTVRRRLAFDGPQPGLREGSGRGGADRSLSNGSDRARSRLGGLSLKGVIAAFIVFAAIGALREGSHLRLASEAPLFKAKADKHLLWVQPLRDHPVCKLMQAGFLDRCKSLGYECEVVGNASATVLDVAATIPLAEAALSRQKFAAVSVLTLDTSIYPFVARLAAEGLPVVAYHELPAEGTVKGLRAAAGEDLTQVGSDAALAMGARLAGRGVVAITQGSFNVEENTKAEAFRRAMTAHYPEIKVLDSQLEGYEATAAKGKAVSLLQGHPDIAGVFSTTGNGAQTWAGAARTAGRFLVIIGMDYIRPNLDLVRSKQVYGIVAQPLYEEGAKTADLAAALAEGKPVPYRNPLPAKVITAANLARYYALLDRVGQ